MFNCFVLNCFNMFYLTKVLLFYKETKKVTGSCWFFYYGTQKKAWNPTVAVPRLEAFALPLVLKRQREAHAEYKITLVLFKVKVRVRAYTYTQKTYHNWHKRDNSISRRTSIVAMFLLD